MATQTVERDWNSKLKYDNFIIISYKMFCVNKQMYMMYAQDMTLDVIFKKHKF